MVCDGVWMVCDWCVMVQMRAYGNYLYNMGNYTPVGKLWCV